MAIVLEKYQPRRRRNLKCFSTRLRFKRNLRAPTPLPVRPARVCLSRYRVKIDALLKLPCFNFINYLTKIVIIFDARTPIFTFFYSPKLVKLRKSCDKSEAYSRKYFLLSTLWTRTKYIYVPNNSMTCT